MKTTVNNGKRTALFWFLAATFFLSLMAHGAGAAKFGTLRNSDWVVTNAWIAASNRIDSFVSSNCYTIARDATNYTDSATNVLTAVIDGKVSATNESGTAWVEWEGDLFTFSYGIKVESSPVMFPSALEDIYFGDQTLDDILYARSLAATNYTDTSISTNNAAFVAAVTNCPVVIAAADAIDIGDYGTFGTVGAALAALAAGLAALKRAKVTSLSSSSTDAQYPSAKCAWDALAQKRGLGDLAVYAPSAYSDWESATEGVAFGTWAATGDPDLYMITFTANGDSAYGYTSLPPSGTSETSETLAVGDWWYGDGGSAGDFPVTFTRTVTAWTPASPADALAKTSQLPTVPSAYTSTPAMDGAGSAGSSTAWARGDHVHPSDTSRAAKTDLPYPFVPATVTQEGPWAFSDDNAAYEVSETESGSTWSYVLSENGAPVDSHSFNSRQTSVEFSYIPSGESTAVTVTATRTGLLTITPRTVATFTADSSAASFTVAVGEGVSDAARDCVLVVDCATNTGAVAPSVEWPSTFHPRGDAEEMVAVAGVRNVFYISEYASSGQFVVGGWHEEVA